MKTTIKDVAKKAGVSAATVSRVVGGYGYVSQLTRNKVLAAVEVLSYLPDSVARSMVTKSTRTIGLVITDIMNPFFAQLARGVENITWKNQYTLILANTDEEVEREKAIIKALLEKRVDAFIVVPACSKNAPHLEELVRYDIPLVLLDRGVQGLDVDTVMVDNKKGAYQAVSHLVKLGHRKIGMLLDNLDISTNIERLEGYRQALTEYGLQVDENFILSCQYTRQSAYELVASMVRKSDRPTALFTANNFMTIGALRAIQEGGLRIPQNVALVGFDDLEWTQFGPPQISAIVQPVLEIGEVAGQRILARITDGTSAPMEIRLATKFVVRESCGAQLRYSFNEK